MYGVMYIYHFVKLLFLKAICKILLKIEYFKKMYIINKGALAIQVKQISVGGTSNLWPTVPALGKNGERRTWVGGIVSIALLGTGVPQTLLYPTLSIPPRCVCKGRRPLALTNCGQNGQRIQKRFGKIPLMRRSPAHCHAPNAPNASGAMMVIVCVKEHGFRGRIVAPRNTRGARRRR